MMDYLLRLAGIDASQIPDDAQVSWTLVGAPRSWHGFVYLAVVAAVGYGVVWLYRSDSRGLTRRARMWLLGLRLATLSLLALILLAPALSLTRIRSIQPQLLVLIDQSQSMSIADRNGSSDQEFADRPAAAVDADVATLREAPLSRFELIQKSLAKDRGRIWRDWQSRGQLKWFLFAHRLQPMSLVDDGDSQTSSPQDALAPSPLQSDLPAGLADARPLGHGTLIAQSIREAIRSVGPAPVAGIVLISDGQNTAPRDEPAAAAAAAALRQAPIFTVGVGDPRPPRNLRIASLYVEEQVWRNDPFELQANLINQGFGGASVEVELLEQRLADDGPHVESAIQSAAETADPAESPGRLMDTSVVDRQTIVLPADDRPLPIVFRRQSAREGQYVYTVRVTPLLDELTADDNFLSASVRVLKDQMRVLLIAGEATWDYRFVTGLLTREPTIDLSCWLQSLDLRMAQEGDTPLAKLPRGIDQLGKFDVVLMLDPDPAEFDDAWFDVVRQYLNERAGGWLFAAGPKHADRWLAESTARGLRDLLPVRLDTPGAGEVESLTLRPQQEWPFAVAPMAIDHPLLKFTTEAAANQRLWQRMPGVYWSFPAGEVKPGARPLLEHSDPTLRTSRGARPLLVVGQYGAGRVAYLGFNSTWRWRRLGKNSEFFNRFWVQTCRYLVEGKLLAGRRRGTLETNAAKYQLGDTATITARLFDAALEPLAAPKVNGLLRAAGVPERAFELTAIANQPGYFEGAVALDRPGELELSIALPSERAEEQIQVIKRISVEPPRVEFADTRLNRGLLQEIAEASGGKYFEIDELEQLAAAIPDQRRTTLVAAEPAPLWDTGRMAFVLMALLSTEWTLRKRLQLL